ncbi:hypothetical protein ACIQD3_23850 [Peribacillus loiseleuriae]|uniref:hypothetical protein n=1 Tax=Peribacillus loiseleuriae TaxID=1679170 RepID=UPI00382FA5B9
MAAIFTYWILDYVRGGGTEKQLATQITNNLVSEQQNKYFRSNIDMSIVAESLVGIIERLTVTQLLQGKKQREEIANEIVHLFCTV